MKISQLNWMYTCIILVLIFLFMNSLDYSYSESISEFSEFKVKTYAGNYVSYVTLTLFIISIPSYLYLRKKSKD